MNDTNVVAGDQRKEAATTSPLNGVRLLRKTSSASLLRDQ